MLMVFTQERAIIVSALVGIFFSEDFFPCEPETWLQLLYLAGFCFHVFLLTDQVPENSSPPHNPFFFFFLPSKIAIFIFFN